MVGQPTELVGEDLKQSDSCLVLPPVNHWCGLIAFDGLSGIEVRSQIPEMLERALGLFPGRCFEEHLPGLEMSDDFLADFHRHRSFIKAEDTIRRAGNAVHAFAGVLQWLQTDIAGFVGLAQQGAAVILVLIFDLDPLPAFYRPQFQWHRCNHFKRLLELAKQRSLGHLFDYGRAKCCSHNFM